MLILRFADGFKYLLHPADIELLQNTSIKKFLTDAYIPRYGVTFPAFMHFIYGYRITTSYIKRICGEYPIEEFLEMMIIDNRVYEVPEIDHTVTDLLYELSSLDENTKKEVFSRKKEHVRKKHSDIVRRIKELEEAIIEIDSDFQKEYVAEWMSLKELNTIHSRVVNKLNYYRFRQDMRTKLPYMFIGLLEMISEHTGRKLSDNYKKNIKSRLREDEGLILELYMYMRKTGIIHTTQTILSVLTNLFVKI